MRHACQLEIALVSNPVIMGRDWVPPEKENKCNFYIGDDYFEMKSSFK